MQVWLPSLISPPPTTSPLRPTYISPRRFKKHSVETVKWKRIGNARILNSICILFVIVLFPLVPTCLEERKNRSNPDSINYTSYTNYSAGKNIFETFSRLCRKKYYHLSRWAYTTKIKHSLNEKQNIRSLCDKHILLPRRVVWLY